MVMFEIPPTGLLQWSGVCLPSVANTSTTWAPMIRACRSWEERIQKCLSGLDSVYVIVNYCSKIRQNYLLLL